MVPPSLRPAALIALVILLQPGLVRAQEAPASAELGERVRVDYVLSGTLVERDGRLLMVKPDAGGPLESVALSDINRLEAWRCCNRMEGFFMGAMIGVGTAVAGGLVIQALDSGGEGGANMAMAGVVLVGIPIGVLVGGGIGSSALAPHHWVEVGLRPSVP